MATKKKIRLIIITAIVLCVCIIIYLFYAENYETIKNGGLMGLYLQGYNFPKTALIPAFMIMILWCMELFFVERFYIFFDK